MSGGSPKVFMFKGELLTIRQISEATGLAVKALNKRVQKGIPLEMPRRQRNTPVYIMFRGRMLRAREIAPIIGVTPRCILQRHHSGQVVDAPPHHHGEEFLPVGNTRSTSFGGSVFNHERPYIFDERARHVMNYLARSETISTDDEIREVLADWVKDECGPGARISDEGVAWFREQLRQDMFVHGSSGHGETLELIGDFDGCCRERIRQLEKEAMLHFRASARRLGLTQTVVEELRDRATRGKPSWAERLSLESPGWFELTAWTESHSVTSLAKRSGRESEVSAAMVEHARRGTAASALVTKRPRECAA